MRPCITLCIVTLLCFLCCLPRFSAEYIRFNNKRTVYLASTVYAEGDTFGSLPANITISLDKSFNGQASYIIFNIIDTNSVQIPVRGIPTGLFCDEELVLLGLCKTEEIGQVLHPRTKDKYYAGVIDPSGYDIHTDRAVVFPVSESGFYMVYVHVTRGTAPMSGYIQFNNPYGYLPGTKYPHMIATIVFSMMYLSIALIWIFYLYKYRDEIIPIQRHVSVLIFLLCLEYLFAFTLMIHANATGEYNFFLRWMFFMTNAVKFTSMLFFALAVAKGYGIVVPRLGDTLNKMYMLAALHFISSILSLSESLSPVQTSEDDVLLYNLPVTITTGIFLVWILRSLRETIQTLRARKQNMKLSLYEKMTRLVTITVVLSFLITLFVMYDLVSHRTDPIWLGQNWPHFWFLLDGWPMFLFFFSFLYLLWLIRPKADNRRYGLEELPTTDIGILEFGRSSIGAGAIGGIFSSPATQHHVPLRDLSSRNPFDSHRPSQYSSSFSYPSTMASSPAHSKGNLPSYSANIFDPANLSMNAAPIFTPAGQAHHQVAERELMMSPHQDYQDEHEDDSHAYDASYQQHQQHTLNMSQGSTFPDAGEDDDMQPFVSAPTSRVASPVMEAPQRPASLNHVALDEDIPAVQNQSKESTGQSVVPDIRLDDQHIWNV